MAVEKFLVQLLCVVFSCTPRQPAPVPESRSITSDFDNGLDTKGPPVLKIPNGWLQGLHMRTILDREIAAFMGIPYAQAPVGELRWRAPKPVDQWDGFFQADKPGPACLQVDASQFYKLMGQEDCLHLSVYTPKIDGILRGDKPLPVLFFLHGGAYFFGSSEPWGPAYLLDHDVILVTVNFRQGVLGYLSTGDEVAPGNYGLKDQALALQWVVSNIALFGGDPTRITMFGVASGASIANLNLMSKQTKDYVSAAILHSGSAHLHWSLVNSTIENSRKVASLFGCPQQDSGAMVECLRRQNPHFVANALQQTYKVHKFPWVSFGPVIEPPGPDAFLEETPFDAYARNHIKKVPMLGGIVANEGDVFVHSLLQIIWKPEILSDINKRWFEVAPFLFDYYDTALNSGAVSTQIRELYLENEPISFNHRDRISRAIGDRFIVQGTYKGLQIHSRVAPTYAYFFDFSGLPSVTSTLAFNRAEWGVTHTDDLLYLLNSTLYYAPLKTSDPEFKVSQYMTEAWANFATIGKPQVSDPREPQWTPIGDPINMEMMEINSFRQMILFPYKARVDFWTSLQLHGDYNLVALRPHKKRKVANITQNN